MPVPTVCLVLNCDGKTENPRKVIHTLPSNNELRKQWLININRLDLLEKFANKRPHFGVCGAHFVASQYAYKGGKKLNRAAIPNSYKDCYKNETSSIQSDVLNNDKSPSPSLSPSPSPSPLSPLTILCTSPLEIQDSVLRNTIKVYKNKVEVIPSSSFESMHDEFQPIDSSNCTINIKKEHPDLVLRKDFMKSSFPHPNLTKIEPEVEYDLENICRICLETGNLLQMDSNYGNVLVKDMVTKCFDLTTTLEQQYPQTVCTNCIKTLKSVYDFIMKCKTSSDILEKYIKKRNETAIINLKVDHDYDKKLEGELKSFIENFNDIAELEKISEKTAIKTYNKKVSDDTLNSIKEKTTVHINGKNFVLAKAFTCKTCREICLTEEILKTHACKPCNTVKIVKPSKKPIRCTKCLNIIKNKKEQMTHVCPIMNNRKRRIRTCIKCNVTFPTCVLLSKHVCDPEKVKEVEELFTTKRFTCKICFVKYTCVKDLNAHRKQEHPDNIKIRKKSPRCSFCKITFESMEALQAHRKESHGPTRIVKCPMCLKRMTAMSYAAHKVLHMNERRYCCEYCGKRFKTGTYFKSHVDKVHHKIRPYECDICKNRFPVRGKMLEHRNKHSKEKRYMCDLCGAPFTYKSTLRAHLIRKRCGKTKGIDVTIKKYECDKCNEKFATLAKFSQHYKENHSNNETSKSRIYRCEVCKLSFVGLAALKDHEVVHGKKEYVCSQCKCSFFTSERFQRHLNVHSNINEKCHICFKGFHSKRLLKTHMLVHNGIKRYSCKYCSKQFSQHAHLVTHTKTHTGARPYVCPYCNKTFALNGNLTVHIRTHTGERPYTCLICNFGFYDSSSHKRHMVQKHNVIMNKKRQFNI